MILYYLACLIIIELSMAQKMSRIGGGKITKKGQYPFFAQIIIPTDMKASYKLECGGTLIDPMWILTAAHCFINGSKVANELARRNKIKVYMGTNKYMSWANDADINAVQKVYIHPKFRIIYHNESSGAISDMMYDVALARLRRPYKLSAFVQVIHLPRLRDGRTDRCKVGVIIGAGEISYNSERSNYVLYADALAKTHKELETKIPKPIVETVFYTEVKMYEGHSLRGDSGGPYVCFDKSGIAVQYGVLSNGGPTSKNKDLAVYEAVDDHIDFISRYVPNVKIIQGMPVWYLKETGFSSFSGPIGRIIGGKQASKDQFPFFVQLREIDKINDTHARYLYAGATLISKQWILSAAHCFPNDPSRQKVIAFLGSMKSFDPQAQQIPISEVRRHPKYFVEFYPGSKLDVRNLYNDIAVARLAQPPVLSKSVQPIVLSGRKKWHLGCLKGIVMGIGRNFRGGNVSNYVHYIEIERKRKFEIVGGIPEATYPTVFYTEVKVGTKHTAIGDSGGPFVCPSERPIMVPVQHGIISHEFVDTNWETFTTTFEDIPQHLEFIRRHVPDVKLNKEAVYERGRQPKIRNVDNYKSFTNSIYLKSNGISPQ
ncbi:hypothetical protein ILUMI_12897, partial [Ignelater luminosus]